MFSPHSSSIFESSSSTKFQTSKCEIDVTKLLTGFLETGLSEFEDIKFRLHEVQSAGQSLRQLRYFSSCSKEAFLMRDRFQFCSSAVFLSLIFSKLALDKYSNFLSCLFNQSGITLDLLFFLKGLRIIYQSKTFQVLIFLLRLVLLCPRSQSCEVLILIILISLQNTI